MSHTNIFKIHKKNQKLFVQRRWKSGKESRAHSEAPCEFPPILFDCQKLCMMHHTLHHQIGHVRNKLLVRRRERRNVGRTVRDPPELDDPHWSSHDSIHQRLAQKCRRILDLLRVFIWIDRLRKQISVLKFGQGKYLECFQNCTFIS